MNPTNVWYTSVDHDDALLLYQFDSVSKGGRESHYEVRLFHGYLALRPTEFEPEWELPEEFSSLDEAFQWAEKHYHLNRASFRNLGGAPRLELDFITSLRSGDISPLAPSMSRAEVLLHMDVPDAVQSLPEDWLCWFYGSIQLYFKNGQLNYIEVPKGVGSFTAMRFRNWLITPRMGVESVKRVLDQNDVPYKERSKDSNKILLIGRQGPGRFSIDFSEGDGTIHAIYWHSSDSGNVSYT